MAAEYPYELPEAIKKTYELEPCTLSFQVFKAWFQHFRAWHYKHSRLLEGMLFAINNNLPEQMPFDCQDGTTLLGLYSAAFEEFQRLINRGEVDMWSSIFGIRDGERFKPTTPEPEEEEPEKVFDILHYLQTDVDLIRDKVAELKDSRAMEMVVEMEANFFTTINKLKAHLGIPYKDRDIEEEVAPQETPESKDGEQSGETAAA